MVLTTLTKKCIDRDFAQLEKNPGELSEIESSTS